jgi:hypothetical protein
VERKRNLAENNEESSFISLGRLEKLGYSRVFSLSRFLSFFQLDILLYSIKVVVHQLARSRMVDLRPSHAILQNYSRTSQSGH